MKLRILIVFFGIVLITLPVYFYGSRLRSTKAPVSQTFDYGRVREGQTVRHSFQVRNPSSQPIKVLKVQKSCACAVVKNPPTEIAPNSVYELAAELDTKGRFGKVGSEINVELETYGSIQLSFKGIVLKSFPDFLDFGRVMAGDMTQRQFFLPTEQSSPVNINGLQYDQRYLTVEYEMDPNGKSQYNFTATLNKDVPYGPIEQTITVDTDDEFLTNNAIAVKGYVIQRFEAKTTKVALGLISPNEEKSGMVEFYSPYEDEISIDRVERIKGDRASWEFTQGNESKDTIKMKIKVVGEPVPQGSLIVEELAVYGKTQAGVDRVDVKVYAIYRRNQPK